MADEFKSAYDQVKLSQEADERIRAALEAALNTNGKVIKLRTGKDRSMKRKTRKIGLTALIAAAAVLALSVTVYAVGEHTGFFETIFGDSGVESTEAYETQADPDKPDSMTITVPAYERAPVDQEAAEDLVGQQVTDANETFEMENVTFTAENMVVDENGIGALTYTMRCPDGFPLMEDQSGEVGNMLEIDEDLGWISKSPIIRLAGTSYEAFAHTYLDSAASTATEKHLTVYFYLPAAEPGDVVELVMEEFLYDSQAYTTPDPDNDSNTAGEIRGKTPVTHEEHLSFSVGELVPAVTLTAEDGMTASVSPMGIVLDDWYDAGPDKLVLDYADGSSYTVTDDGVANVQFGAMVDPDYFSAGGTERGEDADGDGATAPDGTVYPRDDPAYEGMWRTIFPFNRLVEPENVASVHVSGGYDYNGSPQPDRVFVP